MPWITERAAEISWDRLQAAHGADRGGGAAADLRPAEARAAAAARYHADALRRRPAHGDALHAAVATRPTCTSSRRSASTCRTRRRRTGRCSARSRTSGFTPTIGAAAACTVGEIPGRFVDEATQGRRRLADSDRAQPHADGGAVGPDHQHRPRRAARGARLRQPQQELLHRPGRQGPDLRRPHGGRLLRHREQPGQPHHAACGPASTGPRTSTWASCPTCTCRSCWPASRQSTSDQLVHTGVYVGDDLETYLAAARQSREQNITVFDEPLREDRLRDAGRRVLQHLGRQQGRSIARGWPWPTAASW